MQSIRNIKSILKENTRRNAILDAPYDPVSGIGSMIPRKRLIYTDNGEPHDFYAPVSMFDEPVIQSLSELGSVEKVLEKTGDPECKTRNAFNRVIFELRLNHDFEFYCFVCVKIPDKLSEDLIQFKLNRPQRKLVASFDRQRTADSPIRTILVKARQYGGSTVAQIYMNWIQFRHRKRWNMAICTLVNPQAAHIRNMLVRTVEYYPKELGEYTISNYAGTQTNKYIQERDCIIGVGSTQAPENLRTYNIHLCHLSEVGSWKDTPEKSAKSLAQSLRGTIKDMPYTMIVMESTAKGVGNFFYDEWVSATAGDDNGIKSGYDPIFVSWFEIEMYREHIKNMDKFIESLDENYLSDGTPFWYLWELGATLEGINWYRNHKRRENMDDLSMMQEFPSTAEEGFSSTGRPAFSHIHIKKAEKSCCDPELKGELDGKTAKGKESFEDIKFNGSVNGNLWIWTPPDTSIKMSNRYCAFADIGGRGTKADFSVVKVFDRYWMSEGGVPEVAAVWRGHLDQDLFAWKAAQIAFYYNKALLAIEVNSLKTVETDGASHFLTILDEIAPFYSNLYTRTSIEEIRQGVPNKYGFHTNISTKPLLVDTLNAALRDSLYTERDRRATDEMYQFELKDNGSYGAKEGKKDDNVIVTAGGLWLSLKYMPLPKLIIESTPIRRHGPVSEASL